MSEKAKPKATWPFPVAGVTRTTKPDAAPATPSHGGSYVTAEDGSHTLIERTQQPTGCTRIATQPEE